MNVGLPVRPMSLGAWWDSLRGVFSPAASSRLALQSARGRGLIAPPGSAARPVLRVAGRDRLSAVPARTYDHTPRSLAALGRVVERIHA